MPSTFQPIGALAARPPRLGARQSAPAAQATPGLARLSAQPQGQPAPLQVPPTTQNLGLSLLGQVGQQNPDYSQVLSLFRQHAAAAQPKPVDPVQHLRKQASAEAKSLAKNVEFAVDGPIAPGAANIIKLAKKFIGTPYSWGGGTPAGPSKGTGRGANTVGFDCSSFVQFLYSHAGVKLARTTYGQIKQGKAVDPKHLKAGDVLFFGTKSDPHHEALYIGHGQMLEAPHTGAQVRIASVRRGDLVAARRMG